MPFFIPPNRHRSRSTKVIILLSTVLSIAFMVMAGCPTIDSTRPPGNSTVSSLHSYVTIGTPISQNGSVVADIDGARTGRGYDPVLEQWLSMCVEDVGLDTLSGGDAQQVSYEVMKLDSLSELSNTTDVSTKVKVGFGDAFQAGLGFKLGLDRKINQYGTNIVARVRVVGLERTLNQFVLKPWVVQEIKRDPSFITSGRFGQLCGSNFASGYKPGGELFILFSRENSSSLEKTAVEVDLEAKIMSFLQGNASVKNELQQKLGQDKLSLSVYTLGAVTPLPSLDKVLEIVEKFPIKVAEAKGWPLQVRLSPYILVEGVPNLDSPINWAMDRVLKTLADLRSTILPIYLDDMYVNRHRDQFEKDGLDVPALEESLRAADASMKAIENAAKECYVDGNCALPVPLPAIPRRPVSSSTPKSDTEFRAIWRIYPECKPGLERPGAPINDEGCKLTELCGPAGTWQGGSVRKDCMATCLANQDTKQLETTIDGCKLMKRCSPAGTWSGGTTYEECVCKPGRDTRACACPECGNKVQACIRGDGTYSDCPCKRTCPDSRFSPDGGICTWPSSTVGYEAWVCGTVVGGVFMTLNVPSECDESGKYDCHLAFNLKDKGGSCDRDAKAYMQLECADGTVLKQYTAAEIASGYREDNLSVPRGCKLLRARKLVAENGCLYGCVRYFEDLKLTVATKNQCTF